MMNPKHGIVLTLAATALLGAAGWWIRSASVPPPPPRSDLGKADAGAPIVAAAPLVSTRPEADLTLRIAQLLGGPRESVEISSSKQREAQELARQLASALQARPEAWQDVLDLLCCMERAEGAVQVAEWLRDAVDGVFERRLADLVRSEEHPQARRIALTLLASRKTSDSLAALQAAADDVDPRIRLAAVSSLALRRAENDDAVTAALSRRARMDLDPVIRNTALSALGQKIEPIAPPPPARRTALSGVRFGAASR